MPSGTPFHPRTLPLCTALNYRIWSGYYAASSYEVVHEHEYNAIRNGCALIDVSPLYKYSVSGRGARRLIDRVITRDAMALAPGQMVYTPWCDEQGRIVDDGTVACLGDDRFRWTAADPSLRWMTQHASGLDVEIEDQSSALAALAVQGPTSAALLASVVTDADIESLKYYRVTSGRIAGRPLDISRTGYTGDLGYELWVGRDDALHVWDAVMSAAPKFNARPVGLLALDVARIEAGLLLIEVDFFSVRRALIASEIYTPFDMSLDRLVDLKKPHFVGREALVAARAAGATRRIVGLTLEWADVEKIYEASHLPPLALATASRIAVPVYAGSRQVGRMTSSTWSPVLKQMIGLATIDAEFAGSGSVVEVEHTVDAVRHRVRARITKTPFFSPPRKTMTPPPPSTIREH